MTPLLLPKRIMTVDKAIIAVSAFYIEDVADQTEY